MIKKGTVAVVGCGWIGFALAQQLIASGYQVLGSTTSKDKLPSLVEAGIEATILNLPLTNSDNIFEAQTDSTESLLWNADQLVLSIPPRRKNPNFLKDYPASVLSAIMAYRRANSSGRIIFTSSTGVYGRTHGQALGPDSRIPIENPTARQQMLLLAESHVAAQSQRPFKILRLAGLYGPGRDPKRWFVNKEIPRPNDPINLVSQQDVVQQIFDLLEDPFWKSHDITNVVEDRHPTRLAFYGSK